MEEVTDDDIRTGTGEDNSTFIHSNQVNVSQLDEYATEMSITEDSSAGRSLSRTVCHLLVKELEQAP